jgi:hypothetical protein
MKSNILFLVVVTLLVHCLSSFADSPLTSTDFSKAYSDEKMVILASEKHGLLTDALTAYLASDENPVGIKMAIINQLGWEQENRDNALTFLNYLIKFRGYMDKADFRNRGKDFELLCYAYMKSMDNYFEVDEAIEYAGLANAKNKTSYTFSIINALIKAQKKSGIMGAWCDVYNLTNLIREDKSLTLDLNAKAIELIFEYMDGYKDYCPGGSHKL